MVIPSIPLIIGIYTAFHKLFECSDTLLYKREVKIENILRKSMYFIQTHIYNMFELCDSYCIG
jgi:hypothetical protein